MLKKKKIKLSIFSGNEIACIENPKESTKQNKNS